MATHLRVLGWSAKGLRCPDHDISFEKEGNEVHKVSLIQMPNGTGKTTTLRLLRAALIGPQIWDGSFEDVHQFRKNDHTVQGQFDLRLLYNERRLTISIRFNFDLDEVNYTTTNNYGKENGFHPPTDLLPFLSAQFVKLLIFDGELAAQLLDQKHTNAQKAIEEMYQLSFLSLIGGKIEEYWKEVTLEHGSSGGTKEFSRRSSRVAELEGRKKFVRESKDLDQSKLREIKNKLKNLEDEFRQQIEKNKEDSRQLAIAEGKLQMAEQKLNVGTRDLATLMKNPVELSRQFAQAIYALKDNLDRAKLPGIAAREFFNEIADEPHCICGREIDSDIKEVIKAGAKKYLGSEEVAVLNAIKTDIKNKLMSEEDLEQELVIQAIHQVEEAQDAESLAHQELDIIRLAAGIHNPEVDKIAQQISALHKSQGELEREMDKYEDKNDDSDRSWNLEILEKRFARAEEELAYSTNTVAQKRKKDILCRILENAFQKARILLSERICQEANKKIELLMPHNNVRIDVIDKSLRLRGKEGGSVGETLAVGYAFLSSLLSNTDHNLPLVVDSPSGAIDLKIRPEIAHLIPRLADQFIAFTISSERQNFIAPMLQEGADVYFLTLFRKGDSQLDKVAQSMQGSQESEDGIWISGKKYFESFHTEMET